MASYKDTFESHTFAANSFACGTWRGTGVAELRSSVVLTPERVEISTFGTLQLTISDRIGIKTSDVIEER